jgi:hypothetical protein
MKNHVNSTIVTALEKAWAEIHKQNPDVPTAVMVVASGSMGRKGLKLGHFAEGRWITKKKSVEAMRKSQVSEVLIGGEGLEQGGNEVMSTLLHEAAHGMAVTRGKKDTSRGGRYHNRIFAEFAVELGLDVQKNGPHGYNDTAMTKATQKAWKATIKALDKAIARRFRLMEAQGGGKKKAATRMLLAMCECKTKIRLSRAAYEAAPIICSECDRHFVVDE